MRMLAFSIKGYKRFAENSTIRLGSRLVAFVGPNEAGKSTLLEAMSLMNDDEPVPRSRFSRTKGEGEVELRAKFVLDPEDQSALGEIPNAVEVTHCDFIKRSDGKVLACPNPRPLHDTSGRSNILHELETLKRLPRYSRVTQNTQLRITEKAVNAGLEILQSSDELSDEQIQKLRNLARYIKEAAAARNLGMSEQEAAQWHGITNAISSHVTLEENTPGKQAEEILLTRRPQFLIFDEGARDLRRTYDLAEAKELPTALTNLARLAKLDLERLRAAVKDNDVPEFTMLIERANAALKEKFSASWVNRDVVPVLNMQSSVLHLMVQAAGGGALNYIDERSEGLRWFVSLLGFLDMKEAQTQPILLVDEAESHLSYDAQASLISVLSAQRVAQQVIYTTHSAGCLPPDLGTGIRSVVPKQDIEESTVDNSFWTHRSPGFTPILLAMGASALAFTPARYVVLGEGMSECILLPTLIRQATGLEFLLFQVAPGISETSNEKVGGLELEGSRVVYVVDGDNGGKQHKRRLEKAGIPPERIVSFGETDGHGLTLEDFIDLEVFIKAVNEDIADWQQSSAAISIDSFGSGPRFHQLDDWTKKNSLNPINKVTLCQRIVDMRDRVPTLLSSEHRDALVDVYERILKAFKLPPTTSE